jgi:hypothetical protein
MLTKDHAETIARKLKARMHAGSKHEIAVIEYEGKVVAQFGIRRGSRKDQGHDFIPGRIHLNRRDTLSFAECSLTYDDWIQRMKDKGVISVASNNPATDQ